MYIIKNKNCWEKSWTELVTRPIPDNSSLYLLASALPEALDDSEEGTGLVLGGIGAEDESFASADDSQLNGLGLGADEFEGDLLGLLGLLSEDGLGLASESRLLGSVATRSLSLFGVLSFLVLSNLEFSVDLADFAISHHSLGSVHLSSTECRGQSLNGIDRQMKKSTSAHASPGKRPCRVTKKTYHYICCLLINIKNSIVNEVFDWFLSR